MLATIAIAACNRASIATVQPDDDGTIREQSQRTLTQAIMRAYWERDEDIGGRAVLASIAAGAGLDGARLLEVTDAKPARPAFSSATRCSGARIVWTSSSAG